MSPSPRRSLAHQLSDIAESPEEQASDAAMTPATKAVAMTPGSFLKRLTGSTDSGDDEENDNHAQVGDAGGAECEDGQLRSKSRNALQAIEACNLDNVAFPQSDDDKGVDKARSSSVDEGAVQDKQTPPTPASLDGTDSSASETGGRDSGGDDDDDDGMTSDEVMKMKVAQLRKALSNRSASQVGNKATLQSRLLVLLDN